MTQKASDDTLVAQESHGASISKLMQLNSTPTRPVSKLSIGRSSFKIQLNVSDTYLLDNVLLFTGVCSVDVSTRYEPEALVRSLAG